MNRLESQWGVMPVTEQLHDLIAANLDALPSILSNVLPHVIKYGP